MDKKALSNIPNTPGIYCITNTVNGKTYIGQAIKIRKRIFVHINNHLNNRYSNRHLYRAFNKYGIDKFTVKVVELVDGTQSLEELKVTLNEKEVQYIKLYNSKETGYNETDGGDSLSGYVHSEESKRKQSINSKQAYRDGKMPDTKRRVYAYDFKTNMYYMAISRYHLSEILKDKGIKIGASVICRAANGKCLYGKTFLFANSSVELKEKIQSLCQTEKYKHTPLMQINMAEYYEYLKNVADEFGVLPPKPIIAKHFGVAPSTLCGWQRKLEGKVFELKGIQRNCLKGYPPIDDITKYATYLYKFINTITQEEEILTVA